MEVVYDDVSNGRLHEGSSWCDTGPSDPDRPFPESCHWSVRLTRSAMEPHAFVPAVMEHIELAGVHSGDSACIIPSVHISRENVETIKEYTRKIAEEMHVQGLMNMQYAIENGKVLCA